jgi:succinyl-CoA synthetase beta subunit
MNLHEYQSKKIFAAYGIPVPAGEPASTPKEAMAVAGRLGGPVWVVKAQVHAGGRGKAGGVKIVKSVADVGAAAEQLLGQRLVTPQTGAGGLPIHQVYVESGSGIEREIYLSLTLNREKGRIAVVASAAGGMDIEEVAAHHPEQILSETIHPAVGLEAYQARNLAFGLKLSGNQIPQFTAILKALYKLYIDNDASLVEVNPLIVTKEGNLVALDAKIGIDPNALMRHPELVALRDESQEDPMEARAARHDLNYVSLDGDIACMVNGAGLAMATMDVIKLHGGKPANFLDVGGGVTVERGIAAFELILSNPDVKAILVNVFGGIVRCDTVAQAVITAFQKVGVSVPVVVRLEGTNAVQAQQMLKDSGLALIPAVGLTDAARKVVAAAAAK